MSAQREMTLSEWVCKLPEIHSARKEFVSLQATVAQQAERITRLEAEIERKMAAGQVVLDKLAALEAENKKLRTDLSNCDGELMHYMVDVAQQAERIKELEGIADKLRDDGINKIMAASDEQINALCRMEGSNPEDVEKLTKKVMELAIANTRIKQLTEKLAAAERVLVECRSSVKMDLQNYERLLMENKLTGSKEAIADEANRLHKLLMTIDAAITERNEACSH